MVKIRSLRKEDLNFVARLFIQGYDERKKDPNFGDILRLSRPSKSDISRWKINILKEIASGNCIYTVAEEKGRIVGLAFTMTSDLPPSEMSHVGMFGIKVAKDSRGMGVGHALISDMIRRSSSKFDLLQLRVMKNNKRAISLYREFGFKTWGVAPGYVKRGKIKFDLEHMYLKL